MSSKAPYSKAGLLILILVIAAFAGMGIYYVNVSSQAATPSSGAMIAMTSETPAEPAQSSENQTPHPEPVGAIDVPVGQKVAEADTTASPEAETSAPAPAEETAAPVTTDVKINEKAAEETRSIGDAKAPVKIVEYSSLTCPHCGHFHKDTMPDLKKNYIDTGKVYFEFVDFPLNAPALNAALAAHCLPAERYFPFISLLFENQDKWAYDTDYMKYLKQNAQLAGLSGDQFDACMNDKALQTFITDRMSAAQKDKNVNSTPTFIINGKTTISGAQSLETFTKAIDAELNAKK